MLFSRMVGGLGNQLFQTAAFLKYRSNNEKVIISFLGDIHIPKRENCLNYIFEIPDWLYYDNSRKINLFTRFLARSSAGLRFGSYAPYIGVNDRNFYLKNSYFFNKKILFFDGYFINNWKYAEISELFSQLQLRPIYLNREHIKICNENVIIHVRGGDFLKIKHLNICDNYYYKKAIEYALRKGFNTFKVISEDRQYAKEIIKEMKKYFIDLKISILKSNSIKNDFNIIRSSNLAILSNSTFSWWASFLSNSKKDFLVPSNFSLKEKRIILPNENVII
jgi:hypothetical protein